jgi:hypothetical protein
VLVERDDPAERRRVEPLRDDRRRRAVALERPVRHEPVRVALRLHLLGRLPERERLRLREQVRHEQVVVPPEVVEGLEEADEVARHEPRALVEELVERVLAVRPGLAPVHGSRFPRHAARAQGDGLPVRLHRELLQVRRQPLEVLAVGHHADGLRPEEVPVPDPEETDEHGQVLLERRRPEVLVHLVEAGEHRAKRLGADRDHRREADRGVHGVAAADPVPEPEHVGRVDAELADLRLVRGDGDEVLRDPRLVLERGERPLARRARVRHRLESRERLRRHDEERLGGIQPERRLVEVGPVHVRDESEAQAAVREVLQRLVGHDGSEVRAADADVDHVADALAGVAGPLPAPHALRERRHAVQHPVDVRYDVVAVHEDRLAARRAEGDVEDGAVLRHVDPVAAKHRVDPLAQAAVAGERDEEPDGLVGDAVLRVVEEEAGALGGQALPAAGVAREQVAEVLGAVLLEVLLQGFPGGAVRETGSVGHGRFLSGARP